MRTRALVSTAHTTCELRAAGLEADSLPPSSRALAACACASLPPCRVLYFCGVMHSNATWHACWGIWMVPYVWSCWAPLSSRTGRVGLRQASSRSSRNGGALLPPSGAHGKRGGHVVSSSDGCRPGRPKCPAMNQWHPARCRQARRADVCRATRQLKACCAQPRCCGETTARSCSDPPACPAHGCARVAAAPRHPPLAALPRARGRQAVRLGAPAAAAHDTVTMVGVVQPRGSPCLAPSG